MQDEGCVCLVYRLELSVLNFFNTLIFFSYREKRLDSQECKPKQEKLDSTANLLVVKRSNYFCLLIIKAERAVCLSLL